MRELRTQESDKFGKFFSLVRQKAEKNGAVFFVNAGDGNEFETETMEGEDLSGWLIPVGIADEFEIEFVENDVSEKWNDFFMFVICKKNGNDISIEFEQF